MVVVKHPAYGTFKKPLERGEKRSYEVVGYNLLCRVYRVSHQSFRATARLRM